MSDRNKMYDFSKRPVFIVKLRKSMSKKSVQWKCVFCESGGKTLLFSHYVRRPGESFIDQAGI